MKKIKYLLATTCLHAWPATSLPPVIHTHTKHVCWTH